MKKSINFLLAMSILILSFFNISGNYSLIKITIETLQNIYRNIMFNEPLFPNLPIITVFFQISSYSCCIANIFLIFVNNQKKFLNIASGIFSIISLVLVIFITHSFGVVHIIILLFSSLMILYPILHKYINKPPKSNRIHI